MQNPPPELFQDFKKKYKANLAAFLKTDPSSEVHLNEGYNLGRTSVAEKLGMLNVVAIHYDTLIEYLENLATDEHLTVNDKACIFLEEVLAPYQMVKNDFRDAITLLNKNSVDFAVRIRTLQDEITNRKKIEENLKISEKQYRDLSIRLEASLKEKEVLLKEVYHRVKNNLQVVSSLINLQIETIQDISSKKILLESATRIKSMALVHEMLYQSDNLAKIQMNLYINNLLKYLVEAYNINSQQINLVTEIDSIYLNIDFSIPCGLIINELVSNAFKHAFPSGKAGEINISLKETDKQLVLKVSDNGVGLSQSIDMENCQSLGMKLISSLSRQLGGNLTVDRNKGTSFLITFNH